MGVDWPRDRGLTGRMAAALVLVVVLPFAFAWAALLTTNTVGLWLLELTTDALAALELVADRPWNGRVTLDLLVLVGVVAAGFIVQYLLAERTALRSVDARTVSAEEYPEVHAALTRLARVADVPKPTLAVAETEVPNAFTVGVDPSDATVVVTEGLLATLDERERDAVLAHEVAHVRNRDVAVLSMAYFLPALTYAVATLAYLVLVGVFYVLGSGSGVHLVDDDSGGAAGVALFVLITSAVCTLLVSAAFWIGSFLLFRVLSQYREFAADRGAVAITGDPTALVSALQRLDQGMRAVPDEDLRSVDGGLEALYVVPIDSHQFEPERDLVSSDMFPDTHPTVRQRVRRLETMAREQETAGADPGPERTDGGRAPTGNDRGPDGGGGR